ncbi:MAG: HTTM domain-containing protein [Planctomycetes bacterium]|nr:HTTM domain-containing protein [Planctomycetota bacterium]
MIAATRNYMAEVWEAWNEFWFTPISPSTLSAIRVLAGAMLLYTHLVWSFDLNAFFGHNGWLPAEMMQEAEIAGNDPDGPGPVVGAPRWNWSHFAFAQSPKMMWTVHVVALAVFFLLMIGFFSRTMALLGFLFAVSYANRVTPGAYFGLDKINCMLAMYLMLGPCGARYSVDHLWRLKRGGPTEVPPSTFANLAIRMIQIHMCIIYLFSGIGKLQGEPWVTGTASWLSFAMLEYQSLDMTWLAKFPRLLNFMTHLTVFWELSYCALVWPRLTRPWVLLMAVFVHGGIILVLGMPTFGLVMLIGNLAFVSPKTIRKVFDPVARRISLAIVGKASRAGGSD